MSKKIMEKLGVPEQKPKKQLESMEMDIETSLPQLLEFLKKKMKKDAFDENIDTLFRIFNNIRNSVIEEKFRKLKKSNKKIG